MGKHSSTFALGVALSLTAACRAADPPQKAPPSARSSALSFANLPVAPPLPGDNDPAPASPAPLPDQGSLGQRLAREAASRPAGAVRAEALVAALEAQGIAVARTRQVLGKTLHARYCGLAVTRAGLVASVCEYDSPRDAQAALRDSEQRFGQAMPNRRLTTNGKSLLTVANLSPAAGAEASAIAAAFAALRAS